MISIDLFEKSRFDRIDAKGCCHLPVLHRLQPFVKFFDIAQKGLIVRIRQDQLGLEMLSW